MLPPYKNFVEPAFCPRVVAALTVLPLKLFGERRSQSAKNDFDEMKAHVVVVLGLTMTLLLETLINT